MTREWISARAHRKRKWPDNREHPVECEDGTCEPPPSSRPCAPWEWRTHTGRPEL